MARRVVKKREPLVKTTIHPDLHSAIMRFRNEQMKKTGAYINNSQATKMLAEKLQRNRPRILKTKRRNKFEVI